MLSSRGTISTSYHSISTHSLATAGGHPSPVVPLCSRSGKLLPPSQLGSWTIGQSGWYAAG